MLQLKDVHRQVGKHHIIKWVDMTIKNGQAVGIVGPNGCGKTSLLNLINGFNVPTDGEILFNKETITSTSVEQRADRGIGRVFQSFGIFKKLTLFQNLALAYVTELSRRQKLMPLDKLPKQYRNEIYDILDELDLYEKKDEPAGNLSWWQMRLLEIGRLYLQKTKLFLLDEPTAGVSPKLKWTVISLLNKILDTGKMVVIVEHDFWFLGEFVDNFYVVDDGKVMLEGDYKTIKHDPKVKEIYFG